MKQELAVVFVLDALEHARGAARVHRAALACARERDRRRGFARAVAEADRDVQVLQQVCAALGVKPDHLTAARDIIKDAADAMVKQIDSAVAEADGSTAEAIACQYAMLAETRSSANVEVLAIIGPRLPEAAAAVWAEIGSALAAGIRDRQEFARVAWRELQLARMDAEGEEVSATRGTGAAAPHDHTASTEA